jgi:hypothetical protein
MEITISGIAKYPKIDRPYKFDAEAMRSVPCDAMDENASYDLTVVVDEEHAKEIHKTVMQAWNQAVADNAGGKRKWPEKPSLLPVKRNDYGEIEVKTKLKAAYNGQATIPPAQWDAQNNRLPADFRLTGQSKIRVKVIPVPYNMSAQNNGVSLRLKAVQVLELAEEVGAGSPFQPTDGFTIQESSPFDSGRDSVGKSIGIGQATAAGKIKPGEMTAVETEGKPIDWDIGDQEIPF